MGYLTRQKGYRVYDLRKQTFSTSRDVTFYEDIFPLYKNSVENRTGNSNPILQSLGQVTTYSSLRHQ